MWEWILLLGLQCRDLLSHLYHSVVLPLETYKLLPFSPKLGAPLQAGDVLEREACVKTQAEKNVPRLPIPTKSIILFYSYSKF